MYDPLGKPLIELCEPVSAREGGRSAGRASFWTLSSLDSAGVRSRAPASFLGSVMAEIDRPKRSGPNYRRAIRERAEEIAEAKDVLAQAPIYRIASEAIAMHRSGKRKGAA